MKEENEKTINAIFGVDSIEKIKGRTIFPILSKQVYDCMDYEGSVGDAREATIEKITSKSIFIRLENGREKSISIECFAREFNLYWFLDRDAAKEACRTRGFLPWHGFFPKK